MNWLEIHADTVPAALDELCMVLENQGISGLVIDDEGDFQQFLENNHQYWDYVDDDLLKEKKGLCRVTFYLEDSDDGARLLRQAKEAMAALGAGPVHVTVNRVQDADWENNWKQFYKPMEIGERLLVIPEWETASVPGRTDLRLNPGLTFGTGSHATTRLCLAALDSHIRGGERVLDLGCGSGILSIAALLLGAVDAVRDVDGVDRADDDKRREHHVHPPAHHDLRVEKRHVEVRRQHALKAHQAEERDRCGELEQELLDGREAEVLLVLHLFKVV